MITLYVWFTTVAFLFCSRVHTSKANILLVLEPPIRRKKKGPVKLLDIISSRFGLQIIKTFKTNTCEI